MTASEQIVGIIDTQAGNLFSLFSCVERLGLKAVLISDPQQVNDFNVDTLLIPGQGRFGTVLQSLFNSGLASTISDWYLSNKPIIGICVGMQVFFEESEEDPEVKGLGLLTGSIAKIKGPKQPMVGWCELQSSDSLLKDKTVYFVNSYAVTSSDTSIATVDYGGKFIAAIKSRNLTAFQFHPEKSGITGEEVLRQCLV